MGANAWGQAEWHYLKVVPFGTGKLRCDFVYRNGLVDGIVAATGREDHEASFLDEESSCGFLDFLGL